MTQSMLFLRELDEQLARRNPDIIDPDAAAHNVFVSEIVNAGVQPSGTATHDSLLGFLLGATLLAIHKSGANHLLDFTSNSVTESSGLLSGSNDPSSDQGPPEPGPSLRKRPSGEGEGGPGSQRRTRSGTIRQRSNVPGTTRQAAAESTPLGQTHPLPRDEALPLVSGGLPYTPPSSFEHDSPLRTRKPEGSRTYQLQRPSKLQSGPQAGTKPTEDSSTGGLLTPEASPTFGTANIHLLGPLILHLDLTPLQRTTPSRHDIKSLIALPSPFSGPLNLTASRLPTLHPVSQSLPQDTLWARLTRHRGRGGLWDAFESSDNRIFKLSNLSTFPDLDAKTLKQATRTLLTRTEARQDILSECQTISGTLASLQGRVVPVFHGLFGSTQHRQTALGRDVDLQQSSPELAGVERDEVWCAVYGDVGGMLNRRLRTVPAVRRRIISVYEQLHAAGVIHGDVDWKHILGHDWTRTLPQDSDDITAVDPGSIRLIDFGRSRTRYAFGTPNAQQQYRSQPTPGPEALGSGDHEPPESSSTDLRPVQLISDAKWTRMCHSEMQSVTYMLDNLPA